MGSPAKRSVDQQWVAYLEHLPRSDDQFVALPMGGGLNTRDGLARVSWDDREMVVEVADKPCGPFRRTVCEVASVRVAVDILAALDVLPLRLSNTYLVGYQDGRRSR